MTIGRTQICKMVAFGGAALLFTLAGGSVRAEDDATGTAPIASPAASSAPANGSVFVDPLGFLLFGPTVGAEIGLGQYSILAYGRWLDGGLLTKSTFESASGSFTRSYGVGAKGRYYFSRGLLGAHVGVAFEILKTQAEERVCNYPTSTLFWVPEAEGGYRFGFGRFFVGATIAIGYAVQAASSVEQYCVAKDYSTVYGSANLDLGLLF